MGALETKLKLARMMLNQIFLGLISFYLSQYSAYSNEISGQNELVQIREVTKSNIVRLMIEEETKMYISLEPNHTINDLSVRS